MPRALAMPHRIDTLAAQLSLMHNCELHSAGRALVSIIERRHFDQGICCRTILASEFLETKCWPGPAFAKVTFLVKTLAPEKAGF